MEQLSKLSHSVFGNMSSNPPQIFLQSTGQSVLLQVIAKTLIFGIARVGMNFVTTEIQYQYLNFMYSLGLVKRFQPVVPKQRYFVENIIGSAGPLLITSFIDQYIHHYYTHKVVTDAFDFKSFAFIFLSLLVVVDAVSFSL
jgi:hypothetical protein